MPQKSWAVGEEVLAADFNTYVQNQTCPVFTDATQRDSQWASPPNGALCVTVDTAQLWERVGSMWWKTFGLITRSPITTAISVTATMTNLVTTASIGVPSGRRLRLRAHVYATGAGTGFFMQALQDGAAITGATSSRLAQLNALPGASPGAILEGSLSVQPAAGSHTWTLQAQCAGTCSVDGASVPGYFEVFDEGGIA